MLCSLPALLCLAALSAAAPIQLDLGPFFEVPEDGGPIELNMEAIWGPDFDEETGLPAYVPPEEADEGDEGEEEESPIGVYGYTLPEFLQPEEEGDEAEEKAPEAPLAGPYGFQLPPLSGVPTFGAPSGDVEQHPYGFYGTLTPWDAADEEE